MGGATLRPAAPGWRSGFDNQQHAAVDPRKAACGEPVREQRYDRPDWPRCLDCVEIEGITVPAPTRVDDYRRAARATDDPDLARALTDEADSLSVWSEGEKAEAWGR